VTLLAAALGFVAPAGADSTRVSISDFQWSNKNPHVDLGESVTWTWTGPDTQHSVTGQSPGISLPDGALSSDATRWDSDGGRAEPHHDPGDEYKITFDHPGTYLFVCKLHSIVRGEVTVSDIPGDPNSDPGPAPTINWDQEAPSLDGFFFTRDGENPAPAQIGPKGKGISFRFQVSEGGTASADYYRIVKRGKGKRKRTLKLFQGYNEWPIHIGLNLVRFAARSRDFRPLPGKYVAYFHVEDGFANYSKDIPLRFTISSGAKKRR